MSGWTQLPEKLVPQVLPKDIDGPPLRVAGFVQVRLCGLLYPEVNPRDIGPGGIEVRWIRDHDAILEERVRVAYRVAPRTVDRFGQPKELA
jgi:hypothetical protein